MISEICCIVYLDLTMVCCLITRVGDEALISIGEGCSLQHLNVSGCHLIGDSGITAIARGCPQLSYLDVSFLEVQPALILNLSSFTRKCANVLL